MPETREGGCQCGRIRYRISDAQGLFTVCHCSECQRQSGSAFGMSFIVPRSAFEVSGNTKVFERSSDSGRKVACYFCPGCGNRIYHLSEYMPDSVNVKAGTLDGGADANPVIEVFAAERQPWLPELGAAKSFDGSPS